MLKEIFESPLPPTGLPSVLSHQALMSLFVLASKDGWVDIMYDGLDAVGVDQQVCTSSNSWALQICEYVDAHACLCVCVCVCVCMCVCVCVCV